MKTVIFTINKKSVYEEVSQTTSYTGAKMDDNNDTGAYDRIFTTDEDESMLERFWDESKNTVCNGLKKVLQSECESENKCIFTLELSSSFDDSLVNSMQRSLFSFFVMSITAKWFAFTNKKEATAYATDSATHLEDVMRKAFFKKKPMRPTYE